jgi:hypothetical protein
MNFKPEQFGEKEFAERVRKNQDRLRSDLKPHYDFITCPYHTLP